jgi:poly-gamma-glutamate synthesis protein (capsule biosynthesis protein)
VPAGWAAGPGQAGVALLPDLSPATAQRLASDIARWRKPDDRVVVSVHWGGNWGLAVPQAHREFAHRLIDAGAVDVVHGHSSHHALPVEVYRGKLVLYGCGDLVNDYEGIDPREALRSDVGCLYLVTLQRGSGRLDRLEVVPLRLKRFQLTTADAAEHRWLARVYASADRALGQQPARQASGAWCLQPAIGN